MSLSPGTRIGPYEVGARLGAGGMGEVYRAHDTKLNRDVAIKVLAEIVATDPERLARFHREAQVLASLNHPNVAHIYGVEDASATYGLVMELVEGPTLADRIAQGPIPLNDALPIAKQIAEALEAAHEQGIVHRDLKPANIKVRDDGTVKVLDFGLAKLVDSTVSSDANLTMSPTLSLHATVAGVILGTAAYMSPEQARGKAVDKRADIWAFGCVLFEMVTGRRAFGGDNLTETIAAIVRDQPDLSQAPAQLRRLLARCFEKDPRRRLRDISDAWALVDDDVAAKDQPAAGAPGWRRALPWAFAAAAAIAAVSVLLVHLTETRFVPSLVRFQLQVPNEVGSSTPVLSPDGARVAYRAGGQIWVRDLGSLESRAIAPTDRPVGHLFWSSDSRFVVYGAAGKLMRVSAVDGSPETLRDQPLTVAGGFGLPDGGMVVASAPNSTGGREALRIDRTGEHALSGVAGANWLRGGASLLPDGKRFVYTVFQPEASRGVYVASIDSASPPERLLSEASDSAYVPSVNRGDEGYLLLLRQDTLVALPVDARLQPHGEPIELAKGVGSFTASASDSLVYRTGTGRRLTWYDRQGTPTGTAWSPGPYNELALSADGTRVVVVRADGPTTWVHEFARESSGRVATTLPVAIKPMWSPKGDRILVASTRTGQTVEFYSVAADGGSADELVLRSPTVAYPTSWSRDGQWLMYTETNPRTKEDLWIVSTPADGAGKPEPFLVTDNKETDGTFSPDGRAVAYVSDESGTSNVYVRSFPSSGGRKWQVSTAGGYQPRWRSDGKELFYISPSGQLMSVDLTPGITTAPGRPAVLFQTAVFGGGASLNNWYWDVTADGQRFLINTVISGAEPSTLNVVLNWQSGLSR